MGNDFSAALAQAADALGIEAHEKHLYLMTGVDAGRNVARNSRLRQFISSDLQMFRSLIPK